MWSDFLAHLLVTLSQRRQDGQAMVEYALILSLVSVVALVMLGTIGTNVLAIFTAIAGALAPAP